MSSIRTQAKMVLRDTEIVANTGNTDLHSMFGLFFSTRFSGITTIAKVDRSKTATNIIKLDWCSCLTEQLNLPDNEGHAKEGLLTEIPTDKIIDEITTSAIQNIVIRLVSTVEVRSEKFLTVATCNYYIVVYSKLKDDQLFLQCYLEIEILIVI